MASRCPAISPFNIVDNERKEVQKSQENTFSFAQFNLKKESGPKVLKLEDLENHDPNLPIFNIKKQPKKIELKRISRTP